VDIGAKAELTRERYLEIVDSLAEGKEVVGHALLLSGGNDSTIMAHVMRSVATHVIDANTGIGIEGTRQFVRDLSAEWGLPLLEEHPPPGSTYRELVLDQGFPGPAHHWKMYQRLKERCLRQARRQLVTNSRRQRVVFIAGRRRDESARRTNVPEAERQGSVVWVSPMVEWTNADMAEYRREFQVPRNPVADMLHMSGECGCGSFAGKGELEEWSFFFPEFGQQVADLEAEVAVEIAKGNVPADRGSWGWGAYRDTDYEELSQMMADRRAMLCSSCEYRVTGRG